MLVIAHYTCVIMVGCYQCWKGLMRRFFPSEQLHPLIGTEVSGMIRIQLSFVDSSDNDISIKM